ncbi:DUF2680 domain-containing protein [Caproicibacter sp.]|uniref:DUF2680 domain-containing protein n=1 Tax=Caproicibacter sp. TaxID=2814884 RepID=UPI0039896502
MKSWKKAVVIGVTALMAGTVSISAYAASNHQSPAETVAALTGRTSGSVTEERLNTGKTYGAIASEAGVLDEFKDDRLHNRKDILDQQVENGTITQERADEILNEMEERQESCGGTGTGFGGGYAGGRGCFGAGYGRNDNS